MQLGSVGDESSWFVGGRSKTRASVLSCQTGGGVAVGQCCKIGFVGLSVVSQPIARPAADRMSRDTLDSN